VPEQRDVLDVEARLGLFNPSAAASASWICSTIVVRLTGKAERSIVPSSARRCSLGNGAANGSSSAKSMRGEGATSGGVSVHDASAQAPATTSSPRCRARMPKR
jgi:hypothetical protein